MAAFGVLALASLPAQTDRVWDAGASNDNFRGNNNWNPNNRVDTFGERAVFADNGLDTTVIEINGNTNVGGLLFQSSLTDTLSFYRNDRRLTVDQYGLVNNSATTVSFDNRFRLNTSQTWSATNASGGGLTFTNIVENDGNLLTLTTTNANNAMSFSDVISGSGGLTKTGAGQVTLSASNTYTGTTTINGGILQLNTSDALADASNVDIGSGGTLRFDWGSLSDTVGSLSGAGAIDLRGSTLTTSTAADTTFSGTISDSFGVLRKAGTGDLTLSGASTYTGITYIDAGTLIAANNSALGGSTFGNTIASGATLGLQGGITVTENNFSLSGTGDGGVGAVHNLSGNNTLNATLNLTGATTLGSTTGTLTLGNSIDVGSALTLTGAGNFAFGQQLFGSSSLTKSGTGTATFTGSSSNSFSGAANLNDGTTILSRTAGTVVLGQSAINLGDGVGAAGSAILRLGANEQIANYVSTFNLASDGRFDLNGFTESVNVITGTGQVTLGSGTLNVGINSGSSTYDGVISGTGSLTKSGSGTVTLGGSNTYTGATNITGGTLTLAAANRLADTTAVDVSSGATFNLNNFSDTVGSIAGAGNVTLGSGTLTSGGNNTSTAFSGNLSGSGGFTKAGTGTLTLSSSNSLTGNITVAAGTLAISNANALGSGGTTTVQSGGTLALSNNITVATETNLSLAGTGASGAGALRNTSGNNLWDGNISLAGNTTITSVGGQLKLGDQSSFTDTLSLGANTLTLNTAGGDLWVNSIISGTGGVTKTGSGTLTYYMDENTYTGTTTVQDGKLFLNTLSSVSYQNRGIVGNIVIGDGVGLAESAILQHASSQASILIADTANLTVYSDGLYDLNKQVETINALTLQGGAVKMDTGVLTLSSDLTTLASGQTATIAAGTSSGSLSLGSSNRTINVADGAAASDLTITAQIASGGFTKTGAGTLTLAPLSTNPSSYLGTTTISQGIVNVQSASGLGATGSNAASAGTTVASGAQLQLQGGITIGQERLTLNGSGISSDGALRNVSGNNTFGGQIDVPVNSRIESAAGTLTLSGAISGGGQTLTVAGAGNTTFNGTTGLSTLTKIGTGTLTAGATQNYATANINGGTFQLAANNILLDSMNVNLGGSGTFKVNGQTDTIAGVTGTGTLQIASGGQLTVGAGNASSTFSGTMSGDGTGTFEKIGTGTLTLASNITFDGEIKLTGGTFALADVDVNVTTLRITGDSIIDFGGSSILNATNLIIENGAQITIRNWADQVDYFYAANFTGAVFDTRDVAPTNQITFNPPTYTNDQTIWQSYNNEITPVPEPRTTGILLLGLTLGGLALRRRRR